MKERFAIQTQRNIAYSLEERRGKFSLDVLPGLLNRLFKEFHSTEFLASDPLEFVHRYRDPWEQEAIALFAATLAYGNVKQIKKSVQDFLDRIERLRLSPKTFVESLATSRGIENGKTSLKTFVHRFNRGPDLLVLAKLLQMSWQAHGSLGAHFLKYHDAHASDTSRALNGLMRDWKSWLLDFKQFKIPVKKSFYYLLTAPENGSCCKRWCMFLRWMGRRDQLDPGLWTKASLLAHSFPDGKFLRADQLVIPLDTHTGRISQYLGLTERKSLNWKAACEVTENLKRCDAEDPTRYDFSLARLGILDLCQKKYRAEICESCQLLTACRFAGANYSKGNL